MQSGSLTGSFDGLVDDVRIYDHSLTAGEIGDIYLDANTPEPRLDGARTHWSRFGRCPHPASPQLL
ncbi:MAG: hypothetical protein SGI92_29180 [Bryobacteraceae bacterium]|nr:hypothetical protein [Bryobacteraceae bacterium]